MDKSQEKQKKKFHGAINFIFIKKWHPMPSVNATILLFVFGGALMIGLSIMIQIFNNKVVEKELNNYQDSVCEPIANKPGYCKYEFKITEEMKPPTYLFYTIENFYLNHRRFIGSRSSDQLGGTVISSTTADKYCDPAVKNKDIRSGLTSYITGNVLDENDIASPCGLIAKSFFQDRFELYKDSSLTDKIDIDEKGIAWPEDRDKKFKRPSSQAEKEKQWVDPEDEHFIVWMRTSSLSNFQKLWGKINVKLEKDTTYYLQILSTFDVKSFDGKKGVLLSTSGPFGGKQFYSFIAFLVVGILCILLAIFFIVLKIMSKNQFEENVNQKALLNSQ